MPTVTRPCLPVRWHATHGRRWGAMLLVGIVTIVLAGLVTPTPAATADLTTTTPDGLARRQLLTEDAPRLTIRTVTPSRLQPDRPVRLTGVVHNNSRRAWGDVQVSMVVSETPITSTEQLVAARRDPEDLLRQVLREGDDFEDLGDIRPGRESSFTLRNGYDQLLLSGSPGVYVLGVEVRATPQTGPRREVAQSTIFVPLMAEASGIDRVQLAMVWPLTAGVPRAASGYANDSLAAQFGADGRLDALVSMGAGAGDFPLSWIVDPAVLHAATDMSDGYVLAGGTEVGEDEADALAAASWMNRTESALASADVLSVPYGDPDLASLAHDNLDRALAPAVGAGTAVMGDLGITAQRLVWPADGAADQRTLNAGAAMVPSVGLVAGSSVRRRDAGAVLPLASGDIDLTGLVYERAVVSPWRTDTMLQWRQQLLAVTAVRALSGGGVVVVVPPRTLTPDAGWAAADFFGQLRGTWFQPVAIDALITQEDSQGTRLRYPRRARRAELPAENLNEISAVVRTSDSLVGILADPGESQARLDQATGLASSLHWRATPKFGASLARSWADDNRSQLEQVDVETVPFITLSGREGQFPVTVSNGMSDAVRVGVQVQAGDSSVSFEALDPVMIEPEQRRTLPVRVDYPGVGITNVTVALVDRDGETFGASTALKLRTTQIGTAIWVVVAVGATIILFAVGRSVVRRIRGHDADRPSKHKEKQPA
jgi:Family of unknown function (DUF6049)